MVMKNRERMWYYLFAIVLFIAIISYLASQIFLTEKSATLFSFGLVNFAGYLFFLLMPVELLVPYYTSIGHNAWIIGIVAIVTALAAQTIDYGIGKHFSKKVIDNFVGRKRYNKYRHILHRWGGPSIFVFCLFPLSSPILLLVAGIIRFDYRKAMLYSVTGLIIKYAVIAWLF